MAQILQSIVRPPSKPSAPIPESGGQRAIAIILWNLEPYLNLYFRTEPGNLYYKVKATVADFSQLPAKPFVLVENSQAWNGVVDLGDVYNHIFDGFGALDEGLNESAFKTLNQACDLIKTALQQQEPTLLSLLFRVLTYRTSGDSVVARGVRKRILDLAANVLGYMHPVTVIANQITKLSDAKEKSYVWRIVTDSLSRSFQILEDPAPLERVRRRYYNGLRSLGLLHDAEAYLEVLYSPVNGMAKEKNPRYVSEKAYFLREQNQNWEAEVQYRQCLELLRNPELEILAGGTNSDLLGCDKEIDNCLWSLALILERTGRIHEAKAMWYRDLELCSAAWGRDHVATQLNASEFDEFLTKYGYDLESIALRSQYPATLSRRKIQTEPSSYSVPLVDSASLQT